MKAMSAIVTSSQLLSDIVAFERNTYVFKLQG